MDNEKKPCCCCGTPAQPEAATAPAIDASACAHRKRHPLLLPPQGPHPGGAQGPAEPAQPHRGQVRGIRGMLEKDAYWDAIHR